MEAVVQRLHHRALVREAHTHLAEEIRGNQRELASGLASGPKTREQLSRILRFVDEARKNRLGRGVSRDLLVSVWIEQLHSTSWSAAGSSGAIGYMDYGDVEQYSRIYDLQKQYLSVQDHMLQSALALTGSIQRLPQTGSLSKADIEQLNISAAQAVSSFEALQTMAQALDGEYSKFTQQHSRKQPSKAS